MRNVVLFLDFDGVLHPAANAHLRESELFGPLPLLEDPLRQVPYVDVVISSSWREIRSLSEIRGHFADDRRRRIVDATPLRFTASKLPPDAVGFSRQSQCMDWLRRRRRAGTRRVAIDDRPWLWTPSCPNLLLIDGAVGLTPSAAQQLLARLHQGQTT